MRIKISNFVGGGAAGRRERTHKNNQTFFLPTSKLTSSPQRQKRKKEVLMLIVRKIKCLHYLFSQQPTLWLSIKKICIKNAVVFLSLMYHLYWKSSGRMVGRIYVPANSGQSQDLPPGQWSFPVAQQELTVPHLRRKLYLEMTITQYSSTRTAGPERDTHIKPGTDSIFN